MGHQGGEPPVEAGPQPLLRQVRRVALEDDAEQRRPELRAARQQLPLRHAGQGRRGEDASRDLRRVRGHIPARTAVRGRNSGNHVRAALLGKHKTTLEG